jgi:hypothetical protein
MGTMADRYLRSVRHSVHVFLDPLWENDTRKRTAVYQMLARDMCLHKKKCHVAMFDEEQCREAIKILKTYTKEMFNEREDRGPRTGIKRY